MEIKNTVSIVNMLNVRSDTRWVEMTTELEKKGQGR